MPFIESLIGVVRQLPVRGKGRLFDPLTPRSGTREVTVWGRYRTELDLADVVQRQMFMGCFGYEIARTVRALLPPGGRFLDVGAHCGYFTLLAARRAGATGRVFAVEPNPVMFAGLRRVLERNHIPTVRAEGIALGESDGTLRLYLPPAAEHRAHNVTCVPDPDWTPIDVPCRRLDDCLRQWEAGPIDLMKMDVEGSEPRVLAGGQEMLTGGTVRHLMVEVNGPRLTDVGSSPAALVDQLDKLGFQPAELVGRRAVPVRRETWDLRPAGEYDRLFVHRTVTSA